MKSRTAEWITGMVAAAALGGCSSLTGGIVAAGQGAYRVSVSGARYQTQSDTNLKALNAAREYCDSRGEDVMFRQSVEISAHAWSQKQEDLTFVCINATDPGYLRAAVEHDSQVIAQQ